MDADILEDEPKWNQEILNFLLRLHTLGGVKDLAFQIVESRRAVSATTQYISCADSVRYRT